MSGGSVIYISLSSNCSQRRHPEYCTHDSYTTCTHGKRQHIVENLYRTRILSQYCTYYTCQLNSHIIAHFRPTDCNIVNRAFVTYPLVGSLTYPPRLYLSKYNADYTAISYFQGLPFACPPVPPVGTASA